jgi:hypothetical protein
LTLSLQQNHPNPFSLGTTISFYLPEAGNVSIKITTMLGTEIATLISEHRGSGFHQIQWTPGDLPNGAYVCRLLKGSSSVTKILTIAR